VEVEARVTQQPSVDLGRLVGRDVVEDQMDDEPIVRASGARCRSVPDPRSAFPVAPSLLPSSLMTGRTRTGAAKFLFAYESLGQDIRWR